MIRSASTGPAAAEEATAIHKTSPDVVWEEWNIPREEREKRNGHAAQVLWFTGISGAGKSTIARELERQLWDEGKQTMLIDGDQMRHGLSGDLGLPLLTGLKIFVVRAKQLNCFMNMETSSSVHLSHQIEKIGRGSEACFRKESLRKYL